MRCTLSGYKIVVEYNDKEIGRYELISTPCKKCSQSMSSFSKIYRSSFCNWCGDLYGFEKIYAVSVYYTTKDIRSNLLSQHVLKLKKHRKYAVPLAWAMTLCIKHRFKKLLKSDILIPAPASKETLAERGYNQAEELASLVNKYLNNRIPCRTNILEKIKHISMHGLSRTERKLLVRGMYRAVSTLNEKSVLLIDDTCTTGFTISECSKILKGAGASEVNALVAGRTKLRTELNDDDQILM